MNSGIETIFGRFTQKEIQECLEGMYFDKIVMKAVLDENGSITEITVWFALKELSSEHDLDSEIDLLVVKVTDTATVKVAKSNSGKFYVVDSCIEINGFRFETKDYYNFCRLVELFAQEADFPNQKNVRISRPLASFIREMKLVEFVDYDKDANLQIKSWHYIENDEGIVFAVVSDVVISEDLLRFYKKYRSPFSLIGIFGFIHRIYNYFVNNMYVSQKVVEVMNVEKTVSGDNLSLRLF